VSEKTISGPGGFGKTAAGNEKPRSFGVQYRIFCYLCRAIRNSGLSWLNGKIWKIYLSSQVHILLAVQPAPYGMEYGFLRHYGAGYMRLLLQRFSRAVRWVSKQ